MEELLRRMEKSIATFHQDVNSLISNLKSGKINEQEIKIISPQLGPKPVAVEASPGSEAGKQEKLTDVRGISEWEQNLLK